MSKASTVQGEKANGVTTPPATAAAKPRAGTNQIEALQVRLAQRFSQVVGVLMRDQAFKKMPLGELEWLVLPPLLAGQLRLAHAAKPGTTVANGVPGTAFPVALALWARVSDDIDKKLSDSSDGLARLKPADWTSGSNIWLIATAGDRRIVPDFLKELQEKDFKGKTVKIRAVDKDGKVSIKVLGQANA